MVQIENGGIGNSYWIGGNIIKTKEQLLDSLTRVEVEKLRNDVDSLKHSPGWKKVEK